MMKLIYTRKGKYSKIDDDIDFDLVSQYNWYSDSKLGYFKTEKYINGKRNIIYLHRLVMDAPKDMVVDHIDHDPSNNQKSNLRICTRRDNQRNMSVNKKKKNFKGVHYMPTLYDYRTKRTSNVSKVWKAQITVNNKTKYIGRYYTEIEAAEAYNKAALEYFGEFACLNKIPNEE
jgi:hypothetical protein